jgi:hypothetical protein
MILTTILTMIGYWLMTGATITALMFTALGFAHLCQYIADWITNLVGRP